MVISGGGSSPVPVQGGERFYCTPARRQLRAAAAAAAAAEELALKQAEQKEKLERAREQEEAMVEEEERETMCNLERFIASTSPVVPAQFLPRTSTRIRKNNEITEMPQSYFNLSDLWEFFNEWSAYGAGVPLDLNGTDSVVQYYVPFLSALQLFVDKPSPSFTSRRRGDESDLESYQEGTSSDESENERTEIIRESLSRNRETGFSSDDSDSCNNGIQFPVFEFFERDPPYGRQPLADKISILASKFPELNIYTSSDLLPSSWMSVAWYPIYRIPTGPTLQDLDACFLTYHSLSTMLKSDENSEDSDAKTPRVKLTKENSYEISLPLLGLASYKFRGPTWASNEPRERELATNLMDTAYEWLCSRHVIHPDFQFFLSHTQ